MPKNKIPAIIQEIDGAHYNVLLTSIPKLGEQIRLFSFIDQDSGHKPNHKYKVVNIIHEIRDVCSKIESSGDGYHVVMIYVNDADMDD